jgi:outer membrane lipoprotein-sorting protein
MTPDDRLDQALVALRDLDIPDGPPPEIVSRALADLQRESSRPWLFSLYERIRTMPPIVRIAAALLIAAGTTGLVSFMNSGRKGPGVAFADAVEHVRAARTITYTMRIGDDPIPFRVSRMEPGLIRTELPGGNVNIMDRNRGKSLVLNPVGKMATLIETKADGQAGRGEDQIDQLRHFRGKPEQDLGEKVIDGRPARGFRISAGGWTSVIWVDTKTDLPVRMENTINLNAEGPKTVVYSDFVFDAPLNESLFRLTPPEGYKTQAIPLAVNPNAPVEKDLVDLFREYAKRSGGRFPNDLQVPSLLDVLKDIKVTESGLDDPTKAWIAKVGQGIGLVWAMPPDSGALYTGKGVQLGQADRPIFRYRPQGSQTYRVIRGDLTVKDVEPGQIPK